MSTKKLKPWLRLKEILFTSDSSGASPRGRRGSDSRMFVDVNNLDFGPGERDVLGEGISVIVYGDRYDNNSYP